MKCDHKKLLCNKETCDGVEFEHEEHCGVCGVAFEKEKCTCASFFTVRGVHKKDCPCHESVREEKCEHHYCLAEPFCCKCLKCKDCGIKGGHQTICHQVRKNRKGVTMNEKEILEEFVEKGADIEHDRWARWQQYMFSKMVEEEIFEEGGHFKTGNYILPKEFVDRWFRQIDTKYAELSEDEKESDRKETRNYIPILTSSLISLLEEVVPEKIEDSICGDKHKDGYLACRQKLLDNIATITKL